MGLISWVKDLVDANSEEDRRKRVARGDAEWYDDYQKQRGINRVSNNPWQRTVNTVKSTVDNASKAYDQVNMFDNNRTWKQRTPTNNYSVTKQLKENAIVRDYRDRGNAIGKGTVAAVGGYDNLQRELSRSIELDQKAFDQYTRQFRDGKIDRNRYNALMGSLGRDNAAVMGQSRDITKNADPKRYFSAVGETALDVATAGLGGVGFKAGRVAAKEFAKNRAKSGVVKSLQKAATAPVTYTKVLGGQTAKVGAGARIARDTGIATGLGFGSGTLGTVRESPDVGAIDALKSGLLSGAISGAVPLVGATAGVVSRPVGRAVAKNTSKALQGARNTARNIGNSAADTSRKLDQIINPEIARHDAYTKQVQRAYDAETNPTRRKQLQRHLAELDFERGSMAQRGGAQLDPSESPIARGLGGDDAGKAMSIDDPTAALKQEAPYKSFKRKDGKTNITIDGKMQTFDEVTNGLGEKITRLRNSNGDSYSVKGWISDGSWNIKDGGKGEIAWLNKRMADEPVIGRKQEIARQRYQLEQKLATAQPTAPKVEAPKSAPVEKTPQPKPATVEKTKNLARRYKNAYLDELTPEQNAAVADYADFLRSMGEGNGLAILEDGRRVSNNALRPANNGKRMNNTEWFDWAYENLKSGNAEPGALEAFNRSGRALIPENIAPDAEQRVFAQNPMNTARKTTQAIPDAPEEAPLLSQGVDPRSIEANTDFRNTAQRQSSQPETKVLQSSPNQSETAKGTGLREQAPANPQATQKPDTSAPRSRPNTAKSSPTNRADATIDETISPEFNAAVTSKSGKFTDRFVDAMKQDQKLTDAAKKAQLDGSELHYYAEEVRNGAYKLSQFDPQTHRIEAGFVVDNKGNALGNHIKVDSTGIQVNVGGDLINMESIIGDPAAWAKGRTKYLKQQQRYRMSETLSRNIDANAPTKEIAENTKDWLIGSKYKAESKFRTEVDAEYKKLGTRIQNVENAKPFRVSKKQYKDDIFGVLNGDKTDAAIRTSYPKKTADAILTYKKETRALYDSLLKRINDERVKFGQQPIDGRKDYITHLQELNGDKSFVGDIANSIKNSFTDDGMQKSRKGVPANIVGLTETFEPKSAYNKFLQRRTGDKSLRDPFLAVQEYIEPALYNIHLTETTVRARAITTAFRTASELQQMKPDKLLDNTKSLVAKYQKGMVDDKLTNAFNEYSNALARKTQRWDRQIIDASAATAKGLEGWQWLQRVGGRATILGNVSSIMAQPLGQAAGLADAGVMNWLNGIARTVTRNSSIEKSPFITARRIKANKPIRGAFDKTMDATGVPLQKVEMASIEIIWNAQHAKALSKGHKGAKAIAVADMNTERLVAGRGIADRPELYRSTAANGVLQYTLEVMAQHKAIWKDFTPAQKAKFVAAAAAMNLVWVQTTGYEPLPDFLGAAVDTGKDFLNGDDERSGFEKTVGGAQRVAGEYVGMNPIGSAIANTTLDQDDRKMLFGDDSNLGRFEGTAAPIKVVQNSISAGKNLLQGNVKQARNDALRVVPTGNQIRKTTTGAEMLNDGYAVDSKGNPTFAAPEGAFDKAKALLFGPSATSQAKQYYDNDGRRISGKGDLARIQASSDPRGTVQQIQDARAGKTDGINTISSKTERDISGNIVSRDKYDAILDAYSKDKAGNLKLSSYDSKDLVKANREIGTELNSELSAAGLPEIKTDSTTAQIWSKFKIKERDGKISDLSLDSERRSVYRNIYRSRIGKTANEFLGVSSDEEMARVLESGKVTKAQLEEAIALDNFLTESGLQSNMLIGKKLRAALGYASVAKSGSGGGKRKALTKAQLGQYVSAMNKTADVKAPQLATAPRQTQKPQITKIQRRSSTSRSSAAPKATIRKGIRLA